MLRCHWSISFSLGVYELLKQLVSFHLCRRGVLMTLSPTLNSQQLTSLITRRRSVRDFKDTPISLEQALTILNAGQGITGSEGRRATPSAHRLYSLQLYVIAHNIEGLDSAVYEYKPESHELISSAMIPAEGELLDASLASDFWLEDAACVVMICADLKKALEHFSDQDSESQRRGRRYVDFEAGAASQNMHLQAITEGLGAVVVMGLHEGALKRPLLLPEDIEVVAALCIGHSAESEETTG